MDYETAKIVVESHGGSLYAIGKRRVEHVYGLTDPEPSLENVTPALCGHWRRTWYSKFQTGRICERCLKRLERMSVGWAVKGETE